MSEQTTRKAATKEDDGFKFSEQRIRDCFECHTTKNLLFFSGVLQKIVWDRLESGQTEVAA